MFLFKLIGNLCGEFFSVCLVIASTLDLLPLAALIFILDYCIPDGFLKYIAIALLRHR